MNKAKSTTVKSIRMRNDLALKIEKMATKENRNFSNMAETLLLNALNDGRQIAGT